MSDVGYATISVIPSTKNFGRSLSRQVDPQLARAGKSGGSIFAKGLKTAALVGFGAVAAGIGAIVGVGIGEVMDSSAGLAQLRAGIKSTGNEANVTVKGMNRLASSIQAMSGQTDDSIIKAEQLLLTFTNIRNVGPDKIFDQATLATANMAAKMGGDASGAAIQLGKALNDPVKGLVGLGRAGVQFTESQKATVKAMVESGNILGAQKVILKELETQFGGAAKAAGESLPGQLNKAKRSFEDMSQSIVQTLVPIVLPALKGIANVVTKVVLPAIDGFVKGFRKGTGAGGTFRDALQAVYTNGIKPVFDYVTSTAIPALQKFAAEWVMPALRSTGAYIVGTIVPGLKATAEWLKQNQAWLIPVASGVLALVAAYKAYQGVVGIVTAVTKGFAAAQAVLSAIMATSPLGLIVIALAAVGAALFVAYQRSETFRKIVDAAWQGIQAVVGAVVGFFQTYVMPVLSFVFNAIATYLKVLWAVYQPVWNLIYAIAEKVVSWFVVTAWPKIKLFLDLFVVGLKDMWAKIEPVWNYVKAGAEVVVNWFTKTAWPAIQTFVQYVGAAFTAGWPTIVAAWNKVYGAVETVVSWFTATALPAIRGFVTSVVTTFARIVTFVTGIPGTITSTLGDLGTLLYDAGSKIIGGLLSGITDKFEAVKTFVGGIASWIADHKGPISYDRQLLVPAGKAIMDGLNAGLRSQMGALARTVDDIVGGLIKGMASKKDKVAQAATDMMQGLADKAGQIVDKWDQKLDDLKGVLEEAHSKVTDWAANMRDSLLSGFDIGAAYTAAIGEDGKLSAAKWMSGVDAQVAQMDWFTNVLNAVRADAGVNGQALMDYLASKGAAAGGAMGQALIDNGLVQTMADKLGLVQSTATNSAASMVPPYLTAGVAQAQAMYDGFKANFGAGGPARVALENLMDRIAESLNRTSTITIRTVYEAANLPGRASGGFVQAGKAYMVGENGPEPFVPGSNGYIFPHGSLDMAPAATRAAAVAGAGVGESASVLDRLDRLIAAQEATAKMIRDQAERDRTMVRSGGYR